MLNLEPKKVFAFFEEMDRIPRGSGNEKAVSDWVRDWAKEKGLDVYQDELANVVIKKAASAGHLSTEPVILQAHLDMVCEKTPESNHDFLKDPIELKVEGDWVVSANGTSIGADNGIGVALAMAILDDEHLTHPPLEVIFTVDEEETFSGAISISKDAFTAKRMINLDHAKDNEVLAGSCGGVGMNFTMPMTWEESTADGKFFKVAVNGLQGGHSGEDIHRGRGNAIEMLIRILRNDAIKVSSIHAGSFRLAIPRDAESIIMVDADKEAEFLAYFEVMKSALMKEYAVAGSEMGITLTEAAAAPLLRSGEKEKIITIIDLYPNGIMKMNGAVLGVVESSNNVGTLVVSDGKLKITAETRGAYATTVEDVQNKVNSLAAIFGAEVEYFGHYGAWEYKPNSLLRETAQSTYRGLFDGEMEPLVMHAGLECAMFVEKEPEMDAISIGPYCENFHSPNERLSIKSTQKMYKFIVGLLENL